MFKDKRKARRQPLRYTAWLRLEAEQLHGCVLSDVSDLGARIDVEDVEKIPASFLLLLSSNGLAQRKCHVVWRQGHQIGVKFERRLAASDRATLVPNFDADIDVAARAAETTETA
jgi:PilZ domain